MNDLIFKTIATVLITAYLPKAIESLGVIFVYLYKYLLSPIFRLFFFPFKRIYRNKRKQIKEYKAYEVKNREHETIIALYYYVFYNSYIPSTEEQRKIYDANQYYKNRKPIIF